MAAKKKAASEPVVDAAPVGDRVAALSVRADGTPDQIAPVLIDEGGRPGCGVCCDRGEGRRETGGQRSCWCVIGMPVTVVLDDAQAASLLRLGPSQNDPATGHLCAGRQ